jgi:glycosyltransferase involved in cell wall biosynthesis
MPLATDAEESSAPTPKVNLLILASSLWGGGAETVIQLLAENIDRSRFNVTVAYMKLRGLIGEHLAQAGVDIVGISRDPKPKKNYFTFLKLRKIIRERRIDIVHTHTTHGLVDATVCKLLSPRLKVVHTFHFGNYPHTRPRILWMERLFSRIADRLFAVGQTQREQLQRVFGFSDTRVQTVWNGVPLHVDAGDPGFRERIGARDYLLVGTIGTFIEQKGLQDLMRVAARVRDEGLHVKFVIVGEGKLRPELERLRADLGLVDVVALPGWVANAATAALPAFDVFFQPSLWEAMSVVILEAMAASKPVVATRVGENPHILEHDVDGLLVNPRDIEGMSSVLIRVLRDAALRHRLGIAARRKVELKLTSRQMTKTYEGIYLDVLK